MIKSGLSISMAVEMRSLHVGVKGVRRVLRRSPSEVTRRSRDLFRKKLVYGDHYTANGSPPGWWLETAAVTGVNSGWLPAQLKLVTSFRREWTHGGSSQAGIQLGSQVLRGWVER